MDIKLSDLIKLLSLFLSFIKFYMILLTPFIFSYLLTSNEDSSKPNANILAFLYIIVMFGVLSYSDVSYNEKSDLDSLIKIHPNVHVDLIVESDNETKQENKLPRHQFKHDNRLIENSVNLFIRYCNTSNEKRHLSELLIAGKMDIVEFSRAILLKLFVDNRHSMRLLLNYFLYEDNEASRALTTATACLIKISLDASVVNDTLIDLEPTIKLINLSKDSFPFDFISMILFESNQYKQDPITASKITRIDTHDCFLHLKIARDVKLFRILPGFSMSIEKPTEPSPAFCDMLKSVLDNMLDRMSKIQHDMQATSQQLLEHDPFKKKMTLIDIQDDARCVASLMARLKFVVRRYKMCKLIQKRLFYTSFIKSIPDTLGRIHRELETLALSYHSVSQRLLKLERAFLVSEICNNDTFFPLKELAVCIQDFINLQQKYDYFILTAFINKVKSICKAYFNRLDLLERMLRDFHQYAVSETCVPHIATLLRDAEHYDALFDQIHTVLASFLFLSFIRIHNMVILHHSYFSYESIQTVALSKEVAEANYKYLAETEYNTAQAIQSLFDMRKINTSTMHITQLVDLLTVHTIRMTDNGLSEFKLVMRLFALVTLDKKDEKGGWGDAETLNEKYEKCLRDLYL